MKNNTHSVRQIVCSCISMLLTALLTILTYLDPEQVPLAPLLVRMLLLPGLLLVIAGVNFCCLKTGICKLFTRKPDRHTTAVLTVLLAFVLCALGVFPDAAAAAALLLTASAWSIDWRLNFPVCRRSGRRRTSGHGQALPPQSAHRQSGPCCMQDREPFLEERSVYLLRRHFAHCV